mmetsp:Transcript_18752/g.48836  ORF Transcript_18752/g.48836 Transcript_18752/m.48836 type:complete len:243 (+) Transcript_18752:373-1101(+)
MRPDEHKQARSRRYHKNNPAAAEVAKQRRVKRRDDGGNSTHTSESARGAAAAAAADKLGSSGDDQPARRLSLPTSDILKDGDSVERGEDLEDLLARLDGTDASTAHFRFKAEASWDPVQLLADAGFVGATDTFDAALPARHSALWPEMAELSSTLGALPLHSILGLHSDELAVLAVGKAEMNGTKASLGLVGSVDGDALSPAEVALIANRSSPGVAEVSVAKDATGDEDCSDDLEEWLDSVL